MGMAASQARLLSITSRLHDVEYKAQNLQNAKLQLATQQDTAYEEYLEALDQRTLTFASVDASGHRSDLTATFNNLFSVNAANTATGDFYALIDSRGRVVVADDLENGYDAFTHSSGTVQNANLFALYMIFGNDYQNANNDFNQVADDVLNDRIGTDTHLAELYDDAVNGRREDDGRLSDPYERFYNYNNHNNNNIIPNTNTNTNTNPQAMGTYADSDSDSDPDPDPNPNPKPNSNPNVMPASSIISHVGINPASQPADRGANHNGGNDSGNTSPVGGGAKGPSSGGSKGRSSSEDVEGDTQPGPRPSTYKTPTIQNGNDPQVPIIEDTQPLPHMQRETEPIPTPTEPSPILRDGVASLTNVYNSGNTEEVQQFLNYFFNRYRTEIFNNTQFQASALPNFDYYVRMFNAIQQHGGCISINDFNGPDGSAATNSEWLTAMIESGQFSLEVFNTDAQGNVTLSGIGVDSDSNLCFSATTQIDKRALAKAEAAYEHAMKVIDRKEKRIDMELNKIEAERNALTKEIDSVSKVRDDNIERTFGIFS